MISAVSAEIRGLELVATEASRFADDGMLYRFGQVHRGVPIIGRGATVRMGRNGNALLTTSALETELPSSTLPRVTRAEAAEVAARRLGLPVDASRAYLVIYPTFEGNKLAWAVLPETPVVLGAFRVIVDAEDGWVIEARDLRTSVDAQVYPSNPEKSKEMKLLPLAMQPVGEKLENPFLQTHNCIDTKEVKSISFSGLKLNVHVCTLQQRAAPAPVTGNYVYASKELPDPGAGEDEYSEVSMYYHASRAYQFFRELEGNPDAQVVADKPFRTIANLRIAAGIQANDFLKAGDPDIPLEPFGNAFFSPAGGGLGAIFAQIYGFSDGSMWFGQGRRRDYSYDGDVVYHEFTHAVVNRTLRLEAWTIDARGASAAPGGMNEGLADYFSSALTGDPDVGEYASKDFSPGASVIRTLANKDTCDNAIVGEVHFDSTLFSGALWTARSALPPDDQKKFDAAIYRSMRVHSGEGRLSYMQLANYFIQTVGVDLPSAKPLLQKSFEERGVLPSCERVLTFTDTPVEAPRGPSSPRRFTAPGKQSLGLRVLSPGIVQVKASIPPGSLKGTFSFTFEAGSGAGNPLTGGGGKPFAPVVLVKFGGPVNWTTKGKPAHDADLALPVEGTGGPVRVEFEVPPDATVAYAQVASDGDTDGSYNGLAFKFAGDPAVAAPPSAPASPAPAGAASESGCAMTGLGAPSPVVPWGLGLALGLFAWRRRRD